MTNMKLPAHMRAGLPGNVISFCIVPLLFRHRREGVRSGHNPKQIPTCQQAGRCLELGYGVLIGDLLSFADRILADGDGEDEDEEDHRHG